MEIVILPDNEAIGSLGADAIGTCCSASPTRCWAWPPAPRRWRSTTSWPPAAPTARSRSPRPAVSPSTSTSGCPPTTRRRYRNVIDKDFVSRVDFAPGAVQGPDGLAKDIPAACAAYEAAIAAGRRGRPADPRHRHRRAHRLQRARLLAGVADPDQDADPADPDRQRPILRRRPGRGAHALPDPGPGHDHVRPARACWSRPGSGKAEAVHHLVEGRGQRAVAGDHPAASSARHRAAGRRGREPAAAGRLLPRDLPGQAGLAGHLRRSFRPFDPDHATEPEEPSRVDHRRHRRHRPRTAAAGMDRRRPRPGASGRRGRPAAAGRPRAGRGHRGARVRGHARARRWRRRRSRRRTRRRSPTRRRRPSNCTAGTAPPRWSRRWSPPTRPNC